MKLKSGVVVFVILTHMKYFGAFWKSEYNKETQSTFKVPKVKVLIMRYGIFWYNTYM